MIPNIHACPAEVIGIIASYLDVTQIRSLRTVSRALCDKISSGVAFRGLFKHQRSTIDEEDLRSLLNLASHPVLASAVADVTLYMPIYDDCHVREMLRSKRDWTDIRRLPMSMGDQSAPWHDCTAEEMAKAEKDVSWFEKRSQSFERLIETGLAVDLLTKAFQEFGRLNSITLEVAVFHGEDRRERPWAAPGSWHEVWLAAAQGYQVLHAALTSSNLALEGLRLFTTIDSCSVMLPVVAEVLNHNQSIGRSPYKSLKTLGLSFSPGISGENLKEKMRLTEDEHLQKKLSTLLEIMHPHLPSSSTISSGRTPGPAQETADSNQQSMPYETSISGNTSTSARVPAPTHLHGTHLGSPKSSAFAAPARLLQQMPHLEELDLHFCKLRGAEGENRRSEEVLRHITNLAVFPALRRCKLRGLTTTQEGMLNFLERCEQLEYLTLRGIWLTSGTWLPVVAYFQNMTQLEEVTLSALSDQGAGTFNLAPRGKKKWPARLNLYSNSYSCIGGLRVHTRTFTKAELRRKIYFQDKTLGPARGDPRVHNHLSEVRLEFFPYEGWR